MRWVRENIKRVEGSLGTVLCALLMLASDALGNEILRPMDVTELEGEITAEDAHRVKGAKIAWADYDVIRRDFSVLSFYTNEQIDEWLLKNFAFVGSEQPKLNSIRNTSIPILPEKKSAFRPGGWNRSAILEATGPDGTAVGMVDIKGLGHGAQSRYMVIKQTSEYNLNKSNGIALDKLRTVDHSDGLMSFGEAIAEASRQKAVQRLFEMSPTKLETVESYAIIRLPFQIIKEEGAEIPAALYLRQAHVGRGSHLAVPSSIYTDDHGKRQKTASGAAVDFGGVMIQDSRLMKNFGPLPGFDKHLDPQMSKPWAWGHQVAKAFDNGDSSAVLRHIREMLSPLVDASPVDSANPMRINALAIRKKQINSLRAQGLSPMQVINSLEENRISELLPDAFQSRDKERRLFATRSLNGRKDVEALPLIEKMIRDSDRDIAQAAAVALQNRHDTEAISLIEKLLQDSDAGVRMSAAASLFGRSDSASLALIKIALKDELGWVRSTAVRALQGRNDSESFSLIEKAVLQDNYPSVSHAAIQALQGRNDQRSLDLIKKALLSVDSETRLNAVDGLKGRSDSASLDLIEKLLSDTDRGIQVRALHAIEGRVDTKSLTLIKGFLTYIDHDLRKAASMVLASFQGRNDTESLSLINMALNSSFNDVRKSAAKALYGRTDRGSLALIEKAIYDKDFSTVYAAGEALVNRKDPRTLKLIEKIIRSSDERRQWYAYQALKGINDSKAQALFDKSLQSADEMIFKMGAMHSFDRIKQIRVKAKNTSCNAFFQMLKK